MNAIIELPGTNPYQNLAREALLFRQHRAGTATLLLWQNARTVVIGYGQNAWRECRVQQLAQDGGTLARRSSGGGAVFHDLGNLNFTFIVDSAAYSVERQCGVLLEAVRSVGVPAEKQGRNDLVADGRKFSGNAFQVTRTSSLHHGTLMIDVDFGQLARYLSPPEHKLKAKGVSSVPARVVNLRELAPNATLDGYKHALVSAFRAEYGAAEIRDAREMISEEDVAREAQRFSSEEWLFGRTPPFDLVLEQRFTWGGLALHLSLREGVVTSAVAYTDALEPEAVCTFAASLAGSPLRAAALAACARQANAPEDIVEWLAQAEV